VSGALDNLIARARAVRIEDEVERRGIKLSGKKHPAGPCPVCGGRDRFWMNLREQRFGCRGCEVGGDVIALVEHLDGLDFKTAVEMLARDRLPSAPTKAKSTSGGKDENSEYALHIWRSSHPAVGTLVEKYLRSRGITIPPPPSLRFAPRLKHRSNTDAVTFWPAMVALVRRGTDGVPIAVHRTFLDPTGVKAPVEPNKMALGATRGGAVRLAAPGGFEPAGSVVHLDLQTSRPLLVGEGIETCLSAVQATGLPAWSALSAPGLRSLGLPASIRRVTILADADDAGEEAAVFAGQRWKIEGRSVRIARPPPGKDFNDLLREEEVAP